MNRTPFYTLYSKIERKIAPQLKYSQYLYEESLQQSAGEGRVCWLDLGCGHHVLPLWRSKQETELVQKAGLVVGVDYDWPSLQKHRSIHNRVRGDISTLPFADASFDLVTANMVVEHLSRPEEQFREIRRVLKPGGVFLFHTPNAWGYTTVFARMLPEFLKAPLAQWLDGRASADVFKTYYRANTELQIRKMAQRSGLEIGGIRHIASSAKFAVVAPIAFFELLWVRLLLTPRFRQWRTNLIVKLTKPAIC